MKKIYLLLAIWLCCGAYDLQAAHLEAFEANSGLWGQVDRYINDSETEIGSSPNADFGHTSTEAGISGETDYSYASGVMSGYVTSASYWDEGLGTAVIMNSESTSYSEDGNAELWAYGDVAAMEPGNTCGIFFTLLPDGEETVGTPVRVYLRWFASINELYGGATAWIGAFGGNTIYVTRNIQPPFNEIPTSGVVWSFEVPEITVPDYLNQTGSFIAEIGDTIGIFMNVRTRTELLGAGDVWANVRTGVEMLAGETLPTLVEYSYAPGLVYDPDQNITFLKDWSVADEAMNWDEANAWAQDFTYTSNGVTYSNWRLPVTIDEQGASVGEFGYLSTHYGISEKYFGPFANILDGDYWTAPQFERGEDPNIAYAYTFSVIYGPAQWYSDPINQACYVIAVFDGPPTEFWCPADFNNDGIVDMADFATFASYWLSERP